ncbi:MAG: alpha/beta fold hydrolase [Sciscionella sp.]
MPETTIDGLATRYEVRGSGPALLMFSPGGFNATLQNWRTHGVYRRTNILSHLSKHYTCITFDRRESGSSGGRVERISWADYAAQGKGLLDRLGIDHAHLMGGCVGCSVVTTFAVAYPDAVDGMVLYSPAGGAHYRIRQHARIAEHAVYVAQHGLSGVVELTQAITAGFSDDPRVGPWAPVIRTDHDFAESYRHFDERRYQTILAGLGRLMFDRDTVPGPEPEDLIILDVPTLVVPGYDASHATSAARFLHECLANSQYWDVALAEQTEQTAPPRVIDFLAAVDQLASVDGAGSGHRGPSG